MSEMPSEIPPMVLPEDVPKSHSAEVPARRMGALVCGPTGTLVELLASFTLMKQVVKLLIALFSLIDAQSPSREIVSCDFAFEDDLI